MVDHLLLRRSIRRTLKSLFRNMRLRWRWPVYVIELRNSKILTFLCRYSGASMTIAPALRNRLILVPPTMLINMKLFSAWSPSLRPTPIIRRSGIKSVSNGQSRECKFLLYTPIIYSYFLLGNYWIRRHRKTQTNLLYALIRYWVCHGFIFSWTLLTFLQPYDFGSWLLWLRLVMTLMVSSKLARLHLFNRKWQLVQSSIYGNCTTVECYQPASLRTSW
jgi:hypothetical protein